MTAGKVSQDNDPMVSAVPAFSHKHGRERSNVLVAVAMLMFLEAASLGVASALHLSGLVHGRSASFDPAAAGVAEAIIGIVLFAAALVMFRTPLRARTVGIAATSFALVGFLVGISETGRGGDIPDIAYHATVIPLLIAGLVLLVRTTRTPFAPADMMDNG